LKKEKTPENPFLQNQMANFNQICCKLSLHEDNILCLSRNGQDINQRVISLEIQLSITS
jgi:hypothetical protein